MFPDNPDCVFEVIFAVYCQNNSLLPNRQKMFLKFNKCLAVWWLSKFYSMRMKDNESLESCHLRFESIVKTFRLNKGAFSKFQCLIEHETQSGNATDTEEAEGIVEISFLSVAFLLNADQRRYSGLITDLANRCLTGTDDYPRDLPTAYYFLTKYNSQNHWLPMKYEKNQYILLLPNNP